MITAKAIGHEDLVRILGYHPDVGLFRWKQATGPRARVGEVAGTKDKHGYLVIQIKGRIYKAHRLAWFYVTGEWPPEQIDHINGSRVDNRFCNLRLASPGENCQNACRYASNTTGFAGVVFHKRQQKFNASIKKDRKNHHLGSFDTAEEASDAYLKAKAVMHPFHNAARLAA